MDLTTRRGFLKAATVTTAAAVVAGGGAAVALKELEMAQPVATPLVAFAEQTAPAATPIQATISQSALDQVGIAQSAADNTQMVTDLADSLTENVRLQSSLSGAESRIAELERTLQESQTVNASLQSELAGATDRIGILAGAVALYEQMDEIDIGGIVSRGLNEMSNALTNVVDDIPSVREGLAAGRDALQQFDDELPIMNGARLWLLMHMTRVAVLFNNVERMVSIAADNVGPILQLIAEWSASLQKWLPFNLGQKTNNLVQSIADLLEATPDTTTTAQTQVLQPLELWLGRPDTPDMPIRDRVITPIRDNSFASTETHLAKADTLRDDYRTKLTDPTQLALAQRARIQQSIRAYRELHAL